MRVGNAEEVLSIRGISVMKPKSGVWLFESNRPMDPGVSHIVQVEAREHPLDVDAVATRFVRLIPGRIVYLSFGEAAEQLGNRKQHLKSSLLFSKQSGQVDVVIP